MSTNLGFGKPQQTQKPAKQNSKRDVAEKQLDRMRADGLPEYEVYIRIQGKKGWYPVGAIAVNRSSQINKAIFSNQDELLKGAFRLYPNLRKNQNNLEYGYRLKEYKDEPIQIAVPPEAKGGALGNLLAQVQERVSAVFKRG